MARGSKLSALSKLEPRYKFLTSRLPRHIPKRKRVIIPIILDAKGSSLQNLVDS